MFLDFEGIPLFLAPMAGITDMPFRKLCKRRGAQVLMSEMVSTRGIYYDDRKTEKLLTMSGEEHPIGIQLFGNEPEHFVSALKKLESTAYDFIDVNMGCPTPKIVKNGDGCALMRDVNRSFKILKGICIATEKAVTVKIRKGWSASEENAVEFSQMAQEAGVKAVTVHGRTREQFYRGRADWDMIRRVKDAVKIPVVGNGDVGSPEDAKALLETTGCDGIMIGRGALGNPWIFDQVRYYIDEGGILEPPGLEERFNTILNHVDMALEFHGEALGILEMRKHLAWYIRGLPHCASVKRALQQCPSSRGVREILSDYFDRLKSAMSDGEH